ncbi:MAG TPA: chemotaxis protein CheB, partial [Polyangiales bacterium]|nr:chemotaxis protein CheB [Polyangiales bacterium]
MTLAPADAAKHSGGFVRAVAIGVGSSGLGALEVLFSQLRSGSDLAFIVVQHGSPSAPDALTDRIASLTSMRVSRLQYGAQLAANEVRVAPPGYAVELHGGRLQLELPPEPSER